ncbi:ead/Ea22-like family protein [Salmonella enterica]|nr:ead/Ea22-like family protein [Salmonella enterica]ECG1194729.1 ead/Ea22-like family protein [Salmonella bongori]EDI5366493.1 ead/Ea22-like family protein [Salmonella enterica subsp. enterica serovar Senftenberg]EDV8734435.1 ead/Ea22-like family protein [Salmonella enterica subsp. enterica serovar Pomona]EEB1075535.1 ead/Ea22-like family protein [Salmonella enterica subsp. enterica serovar Montevideo]EHB1108228.1 ead/Ea22-like family protein [Salmonella enterica subsp. enterica serovar Typhi
MSNIDKQALREAAEKAGKDKWQAKKINGEFFVIRHGSCTRQHGYTTYQPIAEIDHKQVRDFVALANPATVTALLDELETKEEQRANWFRMAQKLGEDLDTAEKRNAEQREYYEGVIADGSKRIAELERSETQLINERDVAESALADMYQAATGERPEWSNMFGFADAVDVVEERLATLEANQSQTTPTGVQLITEAIGAHGYIVGCLLQGRPDLALEESRKWVSAFGQAAEIVSAQDAAGIGKGD